MAWAMRPSACAGEAGAPDKPLCSMACASCRFGVACASVGSRKAAASPEVSPEPPSKAAARGEAAIGQPLAIICGSETRQRIERAAAIGITREQIASTKRRPAAEHRTNAAERSTKPPDAAKAEQRSPPQTRQTSPQRILLLH